MMNNRGSARLAGEESFQAVIDVVPSVIGLRRNSHHHDDG